MEAREDSVHPWSLERCASFLNKLRLSIQKDGEKRFILLENLTEKFAYPCVLDLKMGTRLWDNYEPESKKQTKTRRARESTSEKLGVRLGGMEVYDTAQASYHVLDKYYGRSLSVQEFKTTVARFFFTGVKFRLDLVHLFRRRLHEIIEILQKLDSFRFCGR